MNLIGHERIQNYLSKLIMQDTLSHAYLFSGPKHIGKSSLITWFLQTFLKHEKVETAIEANPDIRILEKDDDKKEIPIEKVRNLRSFVQQSPQVLSRKFVVIRGVHTLSLPAANALLKTLEDPSGRTTFLFTTDQKGHVLETIQSRCQILLVKPVPVQTIEAYLDSIDIKQARVIASVSAGRPGVALWLANDPKQIEVFVQPAKDLLSLFTKPLSERFAYTEMILKNKKGLIEQSGHIAKILSHWDIVIRDLLLIKLGLFDTITHESMLEELKKNTSSTAQLTSFQRMVYATRAKLKRNANPRLALENLLLELP